MYLDFYNLKLAPFENSPDARFLFAAEHHRDALANVVYALRARKGMVLITGGIGTGKTTICHALEQRGRDVATMIIVRNAPENSNQLLRQVIAGLGQPMSPAADRLELFNAIEARLAEEHRAGRAVMLLIDEAQQLTTAVFDEIRLLSNIETSTAKLIQIVLMGQSELREMLHDPRLEALRQRLVLAPHLRPLTAAELRHYITHRLHVAAAGRVHKARFTDGALEEIYHASGGVPRMINVIVDNALLVGFARSTTTIDGSIVATVLAEALPGLAPVGRHTEAQPIRAAA